LLEDSGIGRENLKKVVGEEAKKILINITVYADINILWKPR
jgi:hypothetical protein